ncbi:uncharacterized protein LOC120353343 [Nilaparvata lugens]|uniref:uncharacterized protein LOC120353343 n=1 Tax=Nilaparvata lugens TaxID=108931 RepID=UPI00193DD870|nr:uncharacterized protein LOC120353343 [Nilaparvata lugens]
MSLKDSAEIHCERKGWITNYQGQSLWGYIQDYSLLYVSNMAAGGYALTVTLRIFNREGHTTRLLCNTPLPLSQLIVLCPRKHSRFHCDYHSLELYLFRCTPSTKVSNKQPNLPNVKVLIVRVAYRLLPIIQILPYDLENSEFINIGRIGQTRIRLYT